MLASKERAPGDAPTESRQPLPRNNSANEGTKEQRQTDRKTGRQDTGRTLTDARLHVHHARFVELRDIHVADLDRARRREEAVRRLRRVMRCDAMRCDAMRCDVRCEQAVRRLRRVMRCDAMRCDVRCEM